MSNEAKACWVCLTTGNPLVERIGGMRCADAGPCEARQAARLRTSKASIPTNRPADPCALDIQRYGTLMGERVMYEVAVHEHGKVMIGGGCNNPCEGLLATKHRWTRITKRPVGLARAVALANEQPGHAVVCEWGSATKVHDNWRVPSRPAGWWPPDATSAFDPR